MARRADREPRSTAAKRRAGTPRPAEAPSPAGGILRLQRTVGNAAVQRLLARRAPSGEAGAVSPAVEAGIADARGGGAALGSGVRGEMETAFGADFGGVRVHTGGQADALSRSLGARAFTTGADVFFRSGEFSPTSPTGKRLLAHELAHVVQQGGSSAPVQRALALGPADDAHEREAEAAADAIAAGDRGSVAAASAAPGAVQRRLIMNGAAADVDPLLQLLGDNAGIVLGRDAATGVVTAVGSLPATPSPRLQAILQQIMDDPAQDAEIQVGTNQNRILVGSFPRPGDLTAGRVQTVDADDVLAVEAGAPGTGVAFLLHEIDENYQAHSFPVVAGTDRLEEAHEFALESESDVAEELVGPGRRVAQARFRPGPGRLEFAFDYDTYYVVLEVSTTAAGDRTVSGARHRPHAVVSTHTIDAFASGSDVVPAAGAAAVARVAADVAANGLATVKVEGHTDDVGRDVGNDILSEDRAGRVRDALAAAGVDRKRIGTVGRGRGTPRVPNSSGANRARNRRVEITVSIPA